MTTVPGDYAKSGLSIRQAMVKHYRQFPNDIQRPPLIWDGRPTVTGDVIAVPENGVVYGEFLSAKTEVPQGFDLKVNGWLLLWDGRRVPLLRTWNDANCEPSVQYSFHSSDCKLYVCNVYKVKYARETVEEKWTGNAGMWIETVSPCERIYHCSHGLAYPPDFDSLVFKIVIKA
jgi:hypothetical protein